MIPSLSEQQVDLFWSKVRKARFGCWLWEGASVAPPHSTARYGQISLVLDGRRRGLKAHRLAYALTKGDPGDLDVLHTCDVTLCVRPAHLFLGTHGDNMQDMIAKGRHRGRAAENREKTECGKGHPLSGDNLYVKANGQRQCKECRRVATKLYMRRKRAAQRE